MAVTIVYKVECHCGGDATATVLDLDNPVDGRITIDVGVAVARTVYECERCGCVTGTGDIDTETVERGGDCGRDDDDD